MLQWAPTLATCAGRPEVVCKSGEQIGNWRRSDRANISITSVFAGAILIHLRLAQYLATYFTPAT